MWQECLTVAAIWTPAVLFLTLAVPGLAEIFENHGRELPLPTRWLVVAGRFVVLHWWAIPAVLLTVVGLQRIVVALMFGHADTGATRQLPGEEAFALEPEKAVRRIMRLHVAGAIIAVALILAALYLPRYTFG